MTIEKAHCEFEGCEKEAVYSACILESQSHSNLALLCGEHIGVTVRQMADDGNTVAVQRESVAKWEPMVTAQGELWWVGRED